MSEFARIFPGLGLSATLALAGCTNAPEIYPTPSNETTLAVECPTYASPTLKPQSDARLSTDKDQYFADFYCNPDEPDVYKATEPSSIETERIFDYTTAEDRGSRVGVFTVAHSDQLTIDDVRITSKAAFKVTKIDEIVFSKPKMGTNSTQNENSPVVIVGAEEQSDEDEHRVPKNGIYTIITARCPENMRADIEDIDTPGPTIENRFYCLTDDGRKLVPTSTKYRNEESIDECPFFPKADNIVQKGIYRNPDNTITYEGGGRIVLEDNAILGFGCIPKPIPYPAPTPG